MEQTHELGLEFHQQHQRKGSWGRIKKEDEEAEEKFYTQKTTSTAQMYTRPGLWEWRDTGERAQGESQTRS